MKKLVLASTMLLALPFTPALADVIFFGQLDLSGLGFGNDPRLLTLQADPRVAGIEAGSAFPIDNTFGDAVSGADKTTTPTVAALNWLTGANVGLALDVSQTGGTGLTLQGMGFELFDGTTAVAAFEIPDLFQITPAMADANHGNGNGVITFTLNAMEQSKFNSILAADGTGLFVGASGSWGCPADQISPTCMPENDGQDTLVGFNAAAVPGPVAGAGIPGLCGLMLLGLARLRQRRQWFWRPHAGRR